MAIYDPHYQTIYGVSHPTVNSDVFTVRPGEVLLLRGFNFAKYKFRDSDKIKLIPQEACLKALIYGDATSNDNKDINKGSKNNSSLLFKETVRIHGKNYTLSHNNNTVIVDVVGTYQYVLNDESAVGKVVILCTRISADPLLNITKKSIGG